MTDPSIQDRQDNSTTGRRLGHRPALDGLRGIAVLLVVLSHLGVLIPRPAITGFGVLDGFIHGGYVGVDLFFVLSGFLITTLLLNEEGGRGVIGFRSFYARRALRLLPALYLFLVTFAFYTAVTDAPWEPAKSSILAALLYYSNWQIVGDLSSVATGTGHLWSLAIEEQFYLVWPLVLVGALGLRRRARLVVPVLVGAIVAVAVHRARLWDQGVNWLDLVVRTDTRADALLAGALLATLWTRRLTPERRINLVAWLTTAGLVIYIANVAPDSDFSNRGGSTLFALGVAVVILAVLNGSWSARRALEAPVLQGIGRVSYGVYIWHLPIFYAVAEHTYLESVPARVGLALGATVVATLVSWFALERPALALKSRVSTHAQQRRPLLPPERDRRQGRRRIAITVTVVVLISGVLLQHGEDVGGAGTFPSGDEDRSSFWRLAGLELAIQDGFERADDAASLGRADTGQRWEPVVGTWATEDGKAVVSGDAEPPSIVLIGDPLRDGLLEVTLDHAAEGMGLVFAYVDPSNYWTLTASPAEGRWTATRVIDGEPQVIGSFDASVDDGDTLSISLRGQAADILVDGNRQLGLVDVTFAGLGRSGLILTSAAGGARWDRFLVMQVPET